MGNMGNMAGMMKKVQKMQNDMKKMQEELKRKTVEVTAGGGVVKVVMDGEKRVQSLTISPAAVDPEDVEMLQDLISAAFNESVKKVDDMMASEMQKMTFTQDPTAIKSLPTESDDLKFLNGQLSVSGKGTLRVYNASGALIRMANIEKKSNVSLNGLKPGLYVISMGDQTIKITK